MLPDQRQILPEERDFLPEERVRDEAGQRRPPRLRGAVAQQRPCTDLRVVTPVAPCCTGPQAPREIEVSTK